MSLLDKLKKFDKPTPVTKKAPKTIKISVDDTKPDVVNKITFEEIANSSEFKRLVYLIQFGKTHRGKSKDLDRKLVKRQSEIKIIREYERGTKQDFRNVVKELKLKLAKQREKIKNV